MHGRPRTTLKRLDDLLHLARQYGSKLYDLMPAQYEQPTTCDDPLGAAWRRAARLAIENFRAIELVRSLITAKVEQADARKRGAEAAE
jgi:hypothetical protein